MTLPKGYGIGGRRTDAPNPDNTTNPQSIEYDPWVFSNKSNCGMGKNYMITFKGRKMMTALLLSGILTINLVCTVVTGYALHTPYGTDTSIWIGNISGVIIGLPLAVLIGGQIKQFCQNSDRWGECGRARNATWPEIVFARMVGKYDPTPREYDNRRYF